MPISQERCRPCGYEDLPLTDEQITELHPFAPAWEIVQEPSGPRLHRAFPYEDWPTAMNFATRISEQAAFENHHPVITISWGRVSVVWWTHVIGGLHRNDFIMACRTDHIFAQSWKKTTD
jgi:4a-hydroxytetrahydrobiopterin dehydratase